MLDVKEIVLSLFDGGGKLKTLVGVSFVCYLVYDIFWNMKKKSESAKAASPMSWMDALLLQLALFKGLSIFFRILSPRYLPFIIACNFLSEIPMLLLFVLICTGWPLVKKPLLLLRKGNMLLLVGIFFMELCLVPYFNMMVFPHDLYNPNRYLESFNIFKFVLLFQAFKSSIVYLKEQGISTYSQASISVYTTELFRSMFFYYPSYLVFRAILAYCFFYSPFSICFNELLSLVFFAVIACKFVPELLLDGVADDKSFLKLLKAHPLLFKSSTT